MAQRSKGKRTASPIGGRGAVPQPIAAPAGFTARHFLAGDDEVVVASFPLSAAWAQPERPLTPAEREVVRGLLAGQSYREIARGRRRSVSTVAKQASRAFSKLGVSSRAELAARGLLPASHEG